jgi:type IV pilus assembly protein PilC
MPGWLTASSQQLESYARQANALIYPLTLLGLALAVFGITFTLVVPIFGSVFDELQIHVPRSTEFLIWASEMVISRTVNIFIYTILGGLLFFVFVRWWRNHALTNRVFGRFVAGRTPNLLAMSSLIESLAELLALKAPLDLALSIAGRNCQHAYYRHAAECLAKNVRSGSIDNVHPQAKIRLPPLLIRSLQIGDAGRPNIPMLRELARLYRDRGQRRSAWESGGPGFAILLVGLIIIWIILVLFMPMISMFTSLAL